MFEIVDRAEDQFGAVINRDHLDTRWKPGLNLLQLGLYTVNHGQSVLSLPHDYDARNSVAGPVQIRDATANIRAEFHLADIFYAHRNTTGRCAQHDVPEILRGLGIASASHHVFGAAEFHQPASDVVVAGAHCFHYFFDRDAIGLQLHRVYVDLVLAHEPAEGRHFGHPRNGLKLITQEPILDGTELSQIVFAATVFEHVLEYPADTSRVGAKFGANALRQAGQNG